MSKLRICQIGIGRTGKEIAKSILNEEDLELVMAVCSPGSSKTGKDVSEILNINATGITIDSCDNLEKNILKYEPDVAIDFSSPDAAVKNAEILGKAGISVVIGTTGFNDIQTERLKLTAMKNDTGILHAPNITLGVNVLMVLTNLAASILESYDSTIVEAHFKDKKDAPSGTAKKIAHEIVKGRSLNYDINPPDISDMPIHAIRAGGIIGSHRVILAGEHDKLEITHESFSRTAFALGALKAVRFVHNKVGFFEMNDVLDLQNVMARYLRRENALNKQKFFDAKINEKQLYS